MELEERVASMENRLTKMETELPHLRESLDRNTKSNDKMTDVLSSLEKTMLEINFKTKAQDNEIKQNKEEIDKVKVKVEQLEDKGKFDIMNWIKSNWVWLAITATLGISLVTKFIGG